MPGIAKIEKIETTNSRNVILLSTLYRPSDQLLIGVFKNDLEYGNFCYNLLQSTHLMRKFLHQYGQKITLLGYGCNICSNTMFSYLTTFIVIEHKTKQE